MTERNTMIGKSFNKYSFTQQLGSGQYGTVYKAVNTKNKQIVAIKVIDKKQMDQIPKLKKLVQSQISILKQVKNENVINFIDSFSSSHSVFIVTQFCNGGDLEQYCKKQGKINQNQALKFLKQILNGFKGLHQHNTMHRDFKLANVLLHNNVCKIADLGFAKQIRQKTLTKTILGTDQTMAPEVHQGKQYGWSADIWSIGVVFYQLLYARPPYTGSNDYEILRKIKTTKASFDNEIISQEAVDFIKKCLIMDPNHRMSWKQIYDHRLLNRSDLQLTNGQLRSKINLKNNIQFYRTSTGEVITNQNVKVNQQIFKMVGNIQGGDLSKAKKIQKNKQQLDAEFIQYQTDLLHERNNRMFGIAQVLILQEKLKQVKINHSRALYQICKNCYIQIKKLRQQIQAKGGSYRSLKYWSQFKKQQVYKNISQQFLDDQNFAQSLTIGYMYDIEQHELNNENMNRPTIINQYRKIIDQYRRSLAKHLKQQNKRTKIKYIKMLKALKCMQQQPSYELQRFQQSVQNIKASQQEQKILKQL